MPIIQPENVVDFVADTLKDLGKPNFTDISSSVLEHVAMHEILQKANGHAQVKTGQGIQFNVLTGQSNAARNVGLAEQDNVNLVDGMVQASTVWRNTQTSYMLIGQLISMNNSPQMIVDYVKQQRIMAMISLVELMESNFWGAPSATDSKTPLGIPYWITKNATEGYTGGTLSGYSTVAGLNTTTYSGWNNWAFPYTDVSRSDFIRSVRKACYKTKFKPPVPYPSPETGGKKGFFTNYAVAAPLEEALEAQNDNLGKDVASMDDEVMLLGRPVRRVPWLDRDTTNPFYGIDWSWIWIYILKDWWMKETMIPNTPGQHTVSSHFIDLTYQFVTRNRRQHFVGSAGTTYPS